jgi:hypothetical protein
MKKPYETICDICGQNKKLVRDNVVRMCAECNKEFEEGMDYSDLVNILQRRGSEWVVDNCIKYKVQETIKKYER